MLLPQSYLLQLLVMNLNAYSSSDTGKVGVEVDTAHICQDNPLSIDLTRKFLWTSTLCNIDSDLQHFHQGPQESCFHLAAQLLTQKLLSLHRHFIDEYFWLTKGLKQPKYERMNIACSKNLMKFDDA